MRYVGARVDDRLVGFMRLVRCRREARLHVAEVRSVHVSPEVRRQGVGTALLRRLVEEARALDIESLILSVLADNAAARRLYESCGFQEYGVEPRAIRKDERYVDQVHYALDVR